MQAVFRVDASISMGTGHVMRCLSLADELKALGANIIFISREHPGHLSDLIQKRGHDVALLSEPGLEFLPAQNDVVHAKWLGVSWHQDAKETLQIMGNTQPDLLIVDHYALDAQWHKELRQHVKKIFVIDDLADRQFDCDILLDQTYERQRNDYQSLVPNDCRMLLGTRYALLQANFSRLRSDAIERRKSFNGVQRILISIGGYDSGNVTLMVLKGLEKVDWSSPPQIDVVLGANAPHLQSVQQYATLMSLNVSVSVDVSDMAERMLLADLAIGAGGITSWERCCLGLPTLMVSNADNQKKISEALSAASAVLLMGKKGELTPNDIAAYLEKVIYKQKLWINLSKNAFKVTDGLGARRICEALVQ